MGTILDTLEALGQSDMVAMHMPGHKRNGGLAPYLNALGAQLDITEIHGCDCLHHADGIIRQAMTRAQNLWQVPSSYLLVNGSTGGLLAAIHASTQRGDRVLMARGCHKAVYNGVSLCGLQVHYIIQRQQGAGYYCGVDAKTVERALQTQPGIRLVVITSPTYEGYLSDVKAIGDICHRHGAVLLVDEAHGAHLGFCEYFTGSAVTAGADIVVQSLHKTLPSLTQTALLHTQGDLVDRAQIQRSLAIFETSSPSYLLLASMDGCLELLETQGAVLFSQWQGRLEQFYQQMTGLEHLSVVQEPSGVKDPSKIVISTAGANCNGTELKERLRQDFHIELEMAYGDYALAMTGMGDTDAQLEQLARALLALDASCEANPVAAVAYGLSALPAVAVPMHQTHNKPRLAVAVSQAEGAIAGGYLWAYPPGIPLITPGEVLSGEILALCQTLEANGVDVQDDQGLWPEKVYTICDTP